MSNTELAIWLVKEGADRDAQTSSKEYGTATDLSKYANARQTSMVISRRRRVMMMIMMTLRLMHDIITTILIKLTAMKTKGSIARACTASEIYNLVELQTPHQPRPQARIGWMQLAAAP
jgi:hypothetical protein